MKYQMIPLPHFDLDWTLTFFRGYNTVVPNPLNRNNLCQFDVKIQTEVAKDCGNVFKSGSLQENLHQGN